MFYFAIFFSYTFLRNIYFFSTISLSPSGLYVLDVNNIKLL